MRSFVLRAAVMILIGGIVSSCGYSLQSTESHELERAGVRKIYISAIRNDTFRAGIETVVYNRLLQALASYRGIELVGDPSDADAILTGIVTSADSAGTATVPASSLNPGSYGSNISSVVNAYGNFYIFSAYTATLSAFFELVKRDPQLDFQQGVESNSKSAAMLEATALSAAITANARLNSENQEAAAAAIAARRPAPKIIWSGSFSHQELYPGSNQLGSLGTTSMLINNSELDRALDVGAKSVSYDMREAMLSRF